MTRPRGTPPIPRAISSPRDPEEITGKSFGIPASPSFIMAPLPNCRSIWLTARSSAFSRFTSIYCLLEFELSVASQLGAELYSSQLTVTRPFGLEHALEYNYLTDGASGKFKIVQAVDFLAQVFRRPATLAPAA